MAPRATFCPLVKKKGGLAIALFFLFRSPASIPSHPSSPPDVCAHRRPAEHSIGSQVVKRDGRDEINQDKIGEESEGEDEGGGDTVQDSPFGGVFRLNPKPAR